MRFWVIVLVPLAVCALVARAAPVEQQQQRADVEKRDYKSQIGLAVGLLGLLGNFGWGWIAWKSLQDNKKRWEEAKHPHPLPGNMYCFITTWTESKIPCVLLGGTERRDELQSLLQQKAYKREGLLTLLQQHRSDLHRRSSEQAGALVVLLPKRFALELKAILIPVKTTRAVTQTTKTEKDNLNNVLLALGIINSLGTIPGLIMTLINAKQYRGNPKVD